MSGETATETLRERAARVLAGGVLHHLTAVPERPLAILTRGQGSRVWDVDGREFVEYGSGLRSVTLGHAHPAVVEAVSRQIARGTNFARPALIELEAAEAFLEAVPTADMVKFAKNGSDATTAAVRLARAHTGRELVAICRDQPFFSTDDWFIGTTPMPAGVPDAVTRLTTTFPFGDLAAAGRGAFPHTLQDDIRVLELLEAIES